MSLEERIAEHVDHCADCIEISSNREKIRAIVEASDHFKDADFRVASDGTVIYKLPEGYEIRDGKLVIDTPADDTTDDSDDYAASPWK